MSTQQTVLTFSGQALFHEEYHRKPWQYHDELAQTVADKINGMIHEDDSVFK